MEKLKIKIGIIILLTLFISCTNKENTSYVIREVTPVKVLKTEEEWKKELTPVEYFIMREKGTEAPFSGKFNLHFEKGIYTCKACGAALFSSDAKYDASCGWPCFDREIAKGKLLKRIDTSQNMNRIEIICASCNSHLGHLYNDGPTETGLRYCVNSLCLNFVKEK